MKLTACVVFTAFILTFVQYADSFCFFGKLKHEAANGKLKEYCQVSESSSLSVGETLTSNCQKCSCTIKGLSCCGIGYNAGVMVIPNCTMQKLDNCCFKFVHNETGDDCTPVTCPHE